MPRRLKGPACLVFTAPLAVLDLRVGRFVIFLCSVFCPWLISTSNHLFCDVVRDLKVRYQNTTVQHKSELRYRDNLIKV